MTTISSKYHLLSVIYYNYTGTSYPLTSLPTLSSTVTEVLSSSPSISMATIGVLFTLCNIINYPLYKYRFDNYPK